MDKNKVFRTYAETLGHSIKNFMNLTEDDQKNLRFTFESQEGEQETIEIRAAHFIDWILAQNEDVPPHTYY